MMKKLMVGLLLASAMAVKADLVTANGFGFVPGPADSSPASETAWVESALGTSGLVFLGKIQNEDPFGFIGNEIQLVGFGPGTPLADLAWDLSATQFELAAVLLKGGQGVSLYVTTMDQREIGSDRVLLNDPHIRDISHISFFGIERNGNGNGNGNGVPDPGSTLAFLGMSLVGLEFFRRKFRLKK